MKILLLCTFYTNYVIQLRNEIVKYNNAIQVDIFTREESKDKYIECFKNTDTRVYYSGGRRWSYIINTSKVLVKLQKYDVVHTLWMEEIWGACAGILGWKSKAWLCSIGGSDLYRKASDRKSKIWENRVVRKSSMYSGENTITLEYFRKVFRRSVNARIESRIIRFGVDIIDSLNSLSIANDRCREKYGIIENRIVVMLGYNGYIQQQHYELLDSLSKVKKEIIDKCYFLLPMTYPDSNNMYIEEVENRIKQITSDYKVLVDYLTTDEMAEIARCTDIMVHVQTTDQLSSVMMSHMYNENIVIAGAWLPYSDIENAGIKFWKVDSIDNLNGKLEEIVNNYECYKREVRGNKDKVYEFSSWEKCARKWIQAYYDLLEER